MPTRSALGSLLAMLPMAIALLSVDGARAQGQAQSQQQGQQQSQQQNLQQASQNPIANMISVPFENNYEWRAGPDRDTTVNVFNIKPVYPITVTENWNLINRAIVPIIHQGSASGQTMIPTEYGHLIGQVDVDSKTGFGDVNYQGYFTPASPGKFIWGVGPSLVIPIGADRFSNNKWSIGPAFVGLTVHGPWVIGATVQNVWSFAGDSDAEDVNAFTAQYFINYNLAKGWYLSSTPVITADWKADNDNKWRVPFGGGFGRVFKIGKQHVNAKLQAFYTPTKWRPDGASDWNVNAQFTFLFPK